MNIDEENMENLEQKTLQFKMIDAVPVIGAYIHLKRIGDMCSSASKEMLKEMLYGAYQGACVLLPAIYGLSKIKF